MTDLIAKAKQISGALKHPMGKLYGSYHLPGFTVEEGRNTLERFSQFNIPDTLIGKTVLDFGSNTGAVALEFARRGANVIGVECNAERVKLCNQISQQFQLPAVFYTYDLNKGLPPEIGNQRFDIVSCMSVDAYMDDRFAIYRIITDLAKETCYLESNYPRSESKDFKVEVENTKDFFRHHFPFVNFVGYSTPKGRRVFVLSHNYFYLPRSITREGDWHVKKFSSYDEWTEIRDIIRGMKDAKVPYILEEDAEEPLTIRRRWRDDLKTFTEIDTRDEELMALYRRQMIEFVIALNKAGYAHRDLYIRNLLFGEQLYVIDFEWATENKVPLCESYDLTGLGCQLPGVSSRVGASTIFLSTQSTQVPKKASIASFLGIEMSDFLA